MSQKNQLKVTTENIIAILGKKRSKQLINVLTESYKEHEFEVEDIDEILQKMELNQTETDQLMHELTNFFLFLSSQPEASSELSDPLDDIKEAEEMEIEEEDDQEEVLSGYIDYSRIYINQVADLEILSLDEELKCGELIVKGKRAEKIIEIASENKQSIPADTLKELKRDISIGERNKTKLVEHNLYVVIAIARRYIKPGITFGLTYYDLVQDGNVGLLRAVEKYDYTRGYRFSTYASWWVKQAIQNGITASNRMIRLPANINEQIRKLNKATAKLVQEIGREPTTAELAEETGWKESDIVSLLKKAEMPLSLDTPVHTDDEPGTPMGYFIPDSSEKDPSSISESNNLREILDEQMKLLSMREEITLKLRFGIEDGQIHTLDEIGREFSLTRERVRQIEKKALSKMCRPAAKKALSAFVNIDLTAL